MEKYIKALEIASNNQTLTKTERAEKVLSVLDVAYNDIDLDCTTFLAISARASQAIHSIFAPGRMITINNIRFWLMGNMDYSECVVNTRGLYYCYSKPSAHKQHMWCQWSRWFQELKSWEYGVISYNCQYFSIAGIVNHEGNSYYCVVTPLHNRAWLLN